jgi:hypothetical protein
MSLNINMPYKKIVVTGCSHSTGYEMNDHLLGTFEDDKQRQFEILKWYKNNFSLIEISMEELHDIANKKWHEAERESSWPALLEKQTGIPVINLSITGASVGRSLLLYSNFLKDTLSKSKLLVIHQLPNFGRMFLKFNKKYGRIDVLPSDVERDHNFEFRKNFYQMEIDLIKNKYKDLIVKENYLEKQYKKIVEKLHYLSVKNNINDYFIFDNKNLIPESIDKVLINNFDDFLNNYTKGVQRHVIDKKFNEDMCKIVRSIL